MHTNGSLLRVAGAFAWLAVLAISIPASSRPRPGTEPHLEGDWRTKAGIVHLTRQGKSVTGTLIAPSPGVELSRGQRVLAGTFEEGNLSADLRLELVAKACHGDAKKAFAVMLLTHTEKLIGGVSSSEACAAKISALVFEKVRKSTGHPKTPPEEQRVPGANVYDAHGRRKEAMRAAIHTIMEDGLQYINEGQFEKARARFLEAVKKDPTVGEAYNGVGATYAARNDYDDAIDWYKRGLEAAPGFGDLYYNLACAYAEEGKKSIAIRYFRLAVKKGYAEVQTIDVDPDLDSLRKDPEFISLRKELDKPVVTPAGGSP